MPAPPPLVLPPPLRPPPKLEGRLTEGRLLDTLGLETLRLADGRTVLPLERPTEEAPKMLPKTPARGTELR